MTFDLYIDLHIAFDFIIEDADLLLMADEIDVGEVINVDATISDAHVIFDVI